MHDKYPSSEHNDPEEKGYYLPHYRDSDSRSAMRHPHWDRESEELPELATIKPLGERVASNSELIRLIKAHNAAPGRLPETPNRMLLKSLPDEDTDSYEVIASTAAYDPKSNSIVYLESGKFIYASELQDLTDGRDTPKNGRSSKQVINEYKNMPYDTMPPVQHVIAYYEEESGNTYYALVGDGAHRLAGAIKRGDEYIPAVSISFVRLSANSISEQLEQLASQEDEPVRRRLGHSILQRFGIHKPGER